MPENTPTFIVLPTDALTEDQGITYNQSGVTYNDSRYLYGGVFNLDQDGPLPTLSLSNTQAGFEDQGYTYNQSGFTFNQLGVLYSGLFNQDEDVIPTILTASLIKPSSLVLTNTNATLEDQGYQYNQTGFSYNQLLALYGGISNQNEDILPLIQSANNITPSAYAILDFPFQTQAQGESRLLESGDDRLLENGDVRLLE